MVTTDTKGKWGLNMFFLNKDTVLQQRLKKLNACSSARCWVADQSLKQAWATCACSSWMEWLCWRLHDVGFLSYKSYRKALLIYSEIDTIGINKCEEIRKAVSYGVIQKALAKVEV